MRADFPAGGVLGASGGCAPARWTGYFAPDGWLIKAGEAPYHEIGLNLAQMARPRRLVAATIVHEQVHLWQLMYGSPGDRGHHNKEWADMMKGIGLMPSSTGAPGGCQTGYQMGHYILGGGAFEKAFSKMPGDLNNLLDVAREQAKS